MRHPLERIDERRRGPAFGALIILTLLMMGVLTALTQSLRDRGKVRFLGREYGGIVGLELAGEADDARELIGSWEETDRAAAAASVGLDYPFILLYSSTLGLGCLMAGDRLRASGWPLAGAGRWLAWGQSVAGILDAVENVALLAMLIGAVASPWPRLAQVCAVPKFLLVAAGIVYGAAGLVARAAEWLTRPRP